MAFSWFSALWVNSLKASPCCIAMPIPTCPTSPGLNECHVIGGAQISCVQPGLNTTHFSQLWNAIDFLKFMTDVSVQEDVVY
jgi:hypothetical protein